MNTEDFDTARVCQFEVVTDTVLAVAAASVPEAGIVAARGIAMVVAEAAG